MLTWHELLDIELRNKGNDDVAALLDEVRRLGVEGREAAYDDGYEAGRAFAGDDE